jgi:hypothetical protein
MRATTRLTALVLAGALTLAGCTSDEDPTETSTTAGSAAPADGDAAASDGESTETIGVDFPDPDDVVADATFTTPGTDDEARIGIESIVVDGSTMELRLVVTPLGGGPDETTSVYDVFDGTVNIKLYDRENLKEYSVLMNTGRRYTSNAVDAAALPGESVGYQEFFSAPQDDITHVDVVLHSAWPAFEDVPLTFVE